MKRCARASRELQRSGPPHPERRRRRACTVGLLDTSIVNVALERIASDLSTDVTDLQWVVYAYTLSFASLPLTGGTLGDRWGIRRVYMLGLALFTAASALCGLSPSAAALFGGRTLQGIGAALLVPCSLASLHHAYPDFAQRTKAISLWAGCGGAALASGPMIGGLLIDVFDWRSIFLVNIPIGLIGIALTLNSADMQERSSGRRLDFLGQFTAIVALGALVATMIEGRSLGWTSTLVLGGWTTAGMAVLLFLWVEARKRSMRRACEPTRTSAQSSARSPPNQSMWWSASTTRRFPATSRPRWESNELASGPRSPAPLWGQCSGPRTR